MGIVKDLLYTRDNEALDIARMAAFLSVVAYLGMSIYSVATMQDVSQFDFFEWASGWAAVCGGNAAWIYARQRIEVGMDYKAPNQRMNQASEYGPYYGGYSNYDGQYPQDGR